MIETILPSPSSVLSLTLIGGAFGLILSIAKIKLRVEKDPRIEKILDVLPGANCGACGQPGCSGYATAIVVNGADITLCPVGGSDVIKDIAEIMGVEAGESGVPRIARVRCHGGVAETVNRFVYEGPLTCTAAQKIMGGFKVCQYGCLGLGECAASCPFDAIYMNENGLPVIVEERCTGCGNCVGACPRDIITLVPENFGVWVQCRNHEKAPLMKKGCSVGCIGCKLCEKACREVHADNPDVDTAISVTDFLAEIDYDKCTNCYKCVEVCPVPVIHPVNRSNKMKKSAEKKAPEAENVKSEQKEASKEANA